MVRHGMLCLLQEDSEDLLFYCLKKILDPKLGREFQQKGLWFLWKVADKCL